MSLLSARRHNLIISVRNNCLAKGVLTQKLQQACGSHVLPERAVTREIQLCSGNRGFGEVRMTQKNKRPFVGHICLVECALTPNIQQLLGDRFLVECVLTQSRSLLAKI